MQTQDNTIARAAAAASHHRIDLTPAYRVDPKSGRATGHGKDVMTYEGAVIGESRQPAYDGARHLLAEGLALRGDNLTTYRDGKACIHTTVGRGAKLTVVESARGGITLRAWRPFTMEEAARATAAMAAAAE
jgi:hypothetical protein